MDAQLNCNDNHRSVSPDKTAGAFSLADAAVQLKNLRETKDQMTKLGRLMDQMALENSTELDEKVVGQVPVGAQQFDSKKDRNSTVRDDDENIVVFKDLRDKHAKLNELKNRLLENSSSTSSPADETKIQRSFSEECDFRRRKNSTEGIGDRFSNPAPPRKSTSAITANLKIRRSLSQRRNPCGRKYFSLRYSQLLYHAQSIMAILNQPDAGSSLCCGCCCCGCKIHTFGKNPQSPNQNELQNRQTQLLSDILTRQQELFAQQLTACQNVNRLCLATLKTLNSVQQRLPPAQILNNPLPDECQDFRVNIAHKTENDQPVKRYCISIADHKLGGDGSASQSMEQINSQPQIESLAINVITSPEDNDYVRETDQYDEERLTSPSSNSVRISIKMDLEGTIKNLLDELTAVLNENADQVFNANLLVFVRKLVISLTTVKCLPPMMGPTSNDAFFKRQLSSILDDTLSKFKGCEVSSCSAEVLNDIGEVVFNEVSFFRLMQNVGNNSSTRSLDAKKGYLCLPKIIHQTIRSAEKSKSLTSLMITENDESSTNRTDTLRIAPPVKVGSDELQTVGEIEGDQQENSASIPITQITTATDSDVDVERKNSDDDGDREVEEKYAESSFSSLGNDSDRQIIDLDTTDSLSIDSAESSSSSSADSVSMHTAAGAYGDLQQQPTTAAAAVVETPTSINNNDHRHQSGSKIKDDDDAANLYLYLKNIDPTGVDKNE